MNTVVVLTLGDIVGLAFFALLVLTVGGWFALEAFGNWKNSPKRWWNRKK